MDRSLDQTRDAGGREAHRLMALLGAPQYVKAADDAQLRGTATTPDRLFADPARRLFPHHTKAACWTSLAFFVTHGDRLPPPEAERIGEKLASAAAFHGLRPELRQLEEKAAALRAEAGRPLPDSEYAFVRGAERRLPLRNAAEVRKAAAWLAEYRGQLAWEDRRRVADRVLAKAAALRADLGEDRAALERTAGRGIGTVKAAAELFRRRADRALNVDRALTEELRKYAALIEADRGAVADPDRAAKLAAAVDVVDRRLGRDLVADLGLPEDALFAITPGAVEGLLGDHVGLANGSVYRKQALAGLRTAKLAAYLGPELAAATTADGLHPDSEKLAAALPALDADRADLFDELCRDSGLAPAATEPVARGLGDRDLLALAGLFTA